MWNEALDYYGRDLTEQDPLEFSMIRINSALAADGDASSWSSSDVPKPVEQILKMAAPVYRTHWWAEHNRTNHEWIDCVTPLIAKYEKNFEASPVSRVQHAVAQRPDARRDELRHHRQVRLHVGAAHPDHRLQLEPAQRGPRRTGNDIPRGRSQPHSKDEGRNRRGRKLSHPDLWHAVMFYTTGE